MTDLVKLGKVSEETKKSAGNPDFPLKP